MQILVGQAIQHLEQLIETNGYKRTYVLVDSNTKEHCLPILNEAQFSFQTIEIKAGEIHKNIDSLQAIWLQLMQQKADRKSLLINLGGGMITDIGGFAAHTYKRGFDFVQIPTTLLAMVDAAIGGKTGIDFNGIKNSIGAFAQPQAVIIDAQFLNTLPKREVLSGFAEIIKYGLIYDIELWQKLITEGLQVHFETVIQRSVEIKEEIVEQDPFEKGVRQILNFGHTIGHAIEALSLVEKTPHLTHGEAVALGMKTEAWLSVQYNGLSKKVYHQIAEFIDELYHCPALNADLTEQALNFMQQDKKNVDGQIRFTLLQSAGTCTFGHTLTAPQIREAMQQTLTYA